jgi:hypothetical protein
MSLAVIFIIYLVSNNIFSSALLFDTLSICTRVVFEEVSGPCINHNQPYQLSLEFIYGGSTVREISTKWYRFVNAAQYVVATEKEDIFPHAYGI